MNWRNLPVYNQRSQNSTVKIAVSRVCAHSYLYRRILKTRTPLIVNRQVPPVQVYLSPDTYLTTHKQQQELKGLDQILTDQQANADGSDDERKLKEKGDEMKQKLMKKHAQQLDMSSSHPSAFTCS